MITGIDQGLAVACTMAGMQASITRTPLSSTLVVGFFFPQFVTTMMVPIAAATFTSYFLTTQNKLFAPQRQRGGTNLFCFSLSFFFFCSFLHLLPLLLVADLVHVDPTDIEMGDKKEEEKAQGQETEKLAEKSTEKAEEENKEDGRDPSQTQLQRTADVVSL